MVLQIVFVMKIISSLVPTHSDADVVMPRTSTKNHAGYRCVGGRCHHTCFTQTIIFRSVICASGIHICLIINRTDVFIFLILVFLVLVCCGICWRCA